MGADFKTPTSATRCKTKNSSSCYCVCGALGAGLKATKT